MNLDNIKKLTLRALMSDETLMHSLVLKGGNALHLVYDITRILILTSLIILVTVGIFVYAQKLKVSDDRFVSYVVDTKKQETKLYWKDDKKQNFKSIQSLRNWLNTKNKKLVFAMNAGMYKQDNSPKGLFIVNKNEIMPLDTTSGDGNFYLKPNGVFYITDDKLPNICTTTNFINDGKVKYATQSGPMLVINGQINSAFKAGSENLNIRNGVGNFARQQSHFCNVKKGNKFL